MKFNKEMSNGTLSIPSGVFKISGFEHDEMAEIHALDSAVVVLKQQMTAMELIQAMDALHQLSWRKLVFPWAPSSAPMRTMRNRLSPSAWPGTTTTCGMCLHICWKCWLKPGSAWGIWRSI